ncbi:MAG: hypothetical protein GXP31_19170 [Kiritimatiellaeota bacterium]|nr:hypothetical protein [Kiritimatiellota bacterium]
MLRGAKRTLPARLLMVVSVLLATSLPAAGLNLRLAPLIEMQSDPEQGPLMRALGPLFERSETFEGELTLALPRPFYCRFEGTGPRPVRGRDFLWPLGVTRRSGNETQQRLLLALHTDRDICNPKSAERRWLLPLVFLGRNKAGHTYAALFPLGGEIDEIASYDQVRFLFFPLYLETQRGTARSRTVLWPVFSRTRSAHGSKWRVFPLIGASSTPNGVQRFFLWPVGHTARLDSVRTGRSTRSFFLLPAMGWSRSRPSEAESPDSKAWTVLWPFFSGSMTPRSRRLHFPWPFFQRALDIGADGTRTLDKTYLWPLAGVRKRGENETYRFFLWPIVHERKSGNSRNGRHSLWVLPFYWSAASRREGEVRSVQRQVWPLVRFARRGKRGLLATPALWPGPLPAPVDRGYAPLWRLYTRRDEGDVHRHDLFWGWAQWSTEAGRMRDMGLFPFFHLSRGRDRTALSLLGGIFRRESTPTRTHRRLLWIFNW